jgi:hypothetical protein
MSGARPQWWGLACLLSFWASAATSLFLIAPLVGLPYIARNIDADCCTVGQIGVRPRVLHKGEGA